MTILVFRFSFQSPFSAPAGEHLMPLTLANKDKALVKQILC